MANNMPVTPGAGATIATEQGASGEQYQKVKLIDPTSGSTAGIGTAANPMPINNAQLAGTAIATGFGVTTAGTQRVVHPIDGVATVVSQQQSEILLLILQELRMLNLYTKEESGLIMDDSEQLRKSGELLADIIS